MIGAYFPALALKLIPVDVKSYSKVDSTMSGKFTVRKTMF